MKKTKPENTRIAILDGYTLNPGDLNWAEIEQFGHTDIYDRTPAKLTIERSKDAEILVVNKQIIDSETLEALPRLKFICVTATGYNNIDIDAAKRRNIPVCNVTGYGAASVAQHVFALILELLNHVWDYQESVKNGDWSRTSDFTYYRDPVIGLAGKTMGIYGFGEIGQKVAQIALAFDMKVIATHKHPERDAREGVTFVSLERLFAESDIVSLHAPLTPENHQVVNSHLLKKMKPSACLINTARGGLVNESDLKIALENNWISGAGLDVLSVEPPPADHPLFELENCIITPHMAWANIDSRAKLLELSAKNIRAFLEGKPINVVNGL